MLCGLLINESKFRSRHKNPPAVTQVGAVCAPLHWQLPGCPRTSPRLFGFPRFQSQNNILPVLSLRRDLGSECGREEQLLWHICAWSRALEKVLWKSWMGGNQWDCAGGAQNQHGQVSSWLWWALGGVFHLTASELCGLSLFTPLNADFLVWLVGWGSWATFVVWSNRDFPLMFGAWVQACRGETIFL